MVNKLSIIGLGKLGASMAACLASRGFEVVGVDVSQHAIDSINSGRSPVQETGLSDLIKEYQDNLRATSSYEDAIFNSDISFVIVPTPSDERGAFSLTYVAHAFENIGKILKQKDSYHLIVLTSTVLPGSTRYNLLPILENFSGKKCGKDFGLCYSPEFIALGTVIRDFLNPDFYLVGEFDERSGILLESINKRVALNHCPSKRMSIENAELAKIAVNSFVTLKISYANMLSDLCERIPGGNIDIVSDAIGIDKRIGRHYLTGGLGYGGPCFPRDNIALNFLGEYLGSSTNILRENDSFNKEIIPKNINKIEHLLQNSKIGVLGLSYKPHSNIVEESSGTNLCNALAKKGYDVTCYDPLANDNAKKVLHKNIVIADSIVQCLQNSMIILITIPDISFIQLSPSTYLGNKESVTIIDFGRCLPNSVKQYPGIHYIPMGCCLNDENATSKLKALWDKRNEPCVTQKHNYSSLVDQLQ